MPPNTRLVASIFFPIEMGWRKRYHLPCWCLKNLLHCDAVRTGTYKIVVLGKKGSGGRLYLETRAGELIVFIAPPVPSRPAVSPARQGKCPHPRLTRRLIFTPQINRTNPLASSPRSSRRARLLSSGSHIMDGTRLISRLRSLRFNKTHPTASKKEPRPWEVHLWTEICPSSLLPSR